MKNKEIREKEMELLNLLRELLKNKGFIIPDGLR